MSSHPSPHFTCSFSSLSFNVRPRITVRKSIKLLSHLGLEEFFTKPIISQINFILKRIPQQSCWNLNITYLSSITEANYIQVESQFMSDYSYEWKVVQRCCYTKQADNVKTTITYLYAVISYLYLNI